MDWNSTIGWTPSPSDFCAVRGEAVRSARRLGTRQNRQSAERLRKKQSGLEMRRTVYFA